MKKYVFVLDAIEVLEKMLNGRHVEGTLFIDKDTGRLTFRPYHRLSREHKKVELLKKTPWGWVEENELAKQALVDQHIIESI